MLESAIGTAVSYGHIALVEHLMPSIAELGAKAEREKGVQPKRRSRPEEEIENLMVNREFNGVEGRANLPLKCNSARGFEPLLTAYNSNKEAHGAA